MNDFLSNSIIKEDMMQIYRSRNSWDVIDHCSFYVSGAAGMIASYLVMFLIYLNEEQGLDITIYAGIRKSEKAYQRFGEYINRKYFHLISSDVTIPFPLDIDVDYIIHAASLASPQYYGIMPVETVIPNTVGTYELLKYAKSHNVKGFLFFSSGDVYGDITSVERITEEMSGPICFLYPGSFYGESKRCGEILCKSFFIEYGIPTKSVRIHHTYGPTLDIKNDVRVFSEFVGNIIQGQDIVIKSDGSAKRAFCYMSDAISGLFIVLLDGKSGESYNLGNSKEFISINELANILVSLFPEKNMKVIHTLRNSDSYTPSKAKKMATVDTSKLENLGWSACINAREGFYRTVQALLNL